MGRSVFETILGGIVLVVAAVFLIMAYQKNDSGAPVDGYELKANFSRIDGLHAGADVTLSGVKIGSVKSQTLNPATYMAELTLLVEGDVKIPVDTVALIASEGLLGGKYISLEVGGDENVLKPGDRIQYTQTAPSLEQLIGQVIFSAGDKKDGDKKDGAAPAAPAPAATAAPQS